LDFGITAREDFVPKKILVSWLSRLVQKDNSQKLDWAQQYCIIFAVFQSNIVLFSYRIAQQGPWRIDWELAMGTFSCRTEHHG
jgi:hypothetical protein